MEEVGCRGLNGGSGSLIFPCGNEPAVNVLVSVSECGWIRVRVTICSDGMD